METNEISNLLDHSRWLLNNGLFSDHIKKNLFMYGAIVHKDVQAVDIDVSPEKRSIKYILFFKSKTIKLIKLFDSLLSKKDLISLWRLNRILRKSGNLDLLSLLTKFVTDYCGPKWSVTLEIKDIKDYKEPENAEA